MLVEGEKNAQIDAYGPEVGEHKAMLLNEGDIVEEGIGSAVRVGE